MLKVDFKCGPGLLTPFLCDSPCFWGRAEPLPWPVACPSLPLSMLSTAPVGAGVGSPSFQTDSRSVHGSWPALRGPSVPLQHELWAQGGWPRAVELVRAVWMEGRLGTLRNEVK